MRPETVEFQRKSSRGRVPEELWTEVHDIIQEAVIKTISKERNAKRLSEEALQIAEEKR